MKENKDICIKEVILLLYSMIQNSNCCECKHKLQENLLKKSYLKLLNKNIIFECIFQYTKK